MTDSKNHPFSAETIARFFVFPNRLSALQLILVIVALSFAVKISYVLVLGGGLNTIPSESTDSLYFDQLARALLSRGVYAVSPIAPTAEMPPGESVFLAMLYAIGDYSIPFAKLAHVGLLTAVPVLTFLTGKQLVSTEVGFWGGVLIAVDPAQAYLSDTFLSDPLFIFMMILGIYLLVRYRSHLMPWQVVGAGLCFALAGLTRNQGWLFVVALWLGSILTRGTLVSTRAATVLLVATLACIAPWTLRNYLVSGRLIPISSEGGLTLWASNNPEFEFRPPMPMSLPIYDHPTDLAQVEIDQFYYHQAIQWIAENPLQFILNGARKLYALFSFDPLSWRPEVSALYRLAGLFPYGLLLPFIVVGIVTHIHNLNWGVILWYLLFTIVVAILFYGDSRIRAPIQPYLYLFSVVGVQRAYGWFQERKIQQERA
jgi:hypothetical protein